MDGLRVTILAPNLALRLGLREMLRSAEDVCVVGDAASPAGLEYSTAEAGVLLAAPASAEWLVLGSVSWPIEAFSAVLVLSDDFSAARRLLQDVVAPGRPWGILPEDASREELLAALRALHTGLTVVPPALAGSLLQRPTAGEAVPGLVPLDDALTARETEILGWIAQGLANKQIAARLQISEHTVKFHISSLYAKLGAASRAEAVHIGAQRGLIVV